MMLIKYLILISFLNLVLSEAYALVCVEDKDTIKYENIFESCCNKDNQHLLTQQNTSDHIIQNSTDKCCVDYEHNFTYERERYTTYFNCKYFSTTEIASKEFGSQNCYNDSQKINSINFYNLHQVKTNVLRI